MSTRYNEHESSSGCSYANLSHYNNGSKGKHPHIPKGNVTGYVVPTYDSVGYDTLTHKKYNDSCCGNPYPNIRAAYKTHDGNCHQKYVHMNCNK
jgi:hypothetical protein